MPGTRTAGQPPIFHAREARPCRLGYCGVPVCPERILRLASSWILASAYTPAASQSPPPNGAWPENIWFDKTIVFPNLLSFACHITRAGFPQHCLYFLPEPQPQGSLRPIFRSAWRYDVPSAASLASNGISFWELFHNPEYGFIRPDGSPIVRPVLIFDQVEEIFYSG